MDLRMATRALDTGERQVGGIFDTDGMARGDERRQHAICDWLKPGKN
jgi:hypothetical protein